MSNVYSNVLSSYIASSNNKNNESEISSETIASIEEEITKRCDNKYSYQQKEYLVFNTKKEKEYKAKFIQSKQDSYYKKLIIALADESALLNLLKKELKEQYTIDPFELFEWVQEYNLFSKEDYDKIRNYIIKHEDKTFYEKMKHLNNRFDGEETYEGFVEYVNLLNGEELYELFKEKNYSMNKVFKIKDFLSQTIDCRVQDINLHENYIRQYATVQEVVNYYLENKIIKKESYEDYLSKHNTLEQDYEEYKTNKIKYKKSFYYVHPLNENSVA